MRTINWRNPYGLGTPATIIFTKQIFFLLIFLCYIFRFVTPSPGAYNPQSADKETRRSEPMFSFGIKVATWKEEEALTSFFLIQVDIKKGPHCPGPNAYTPNVVKESPQYRSPC